MFLLKHCPFVFFYPGQGDNFSPKKKKKKTKGQCFNENTIYGVIDGKNNCGGVARVAWGPSSGVFSPLAHAGGPGPGLAYREEESS